MRLGEQARKCVVYLGFHDGTPNGIAPQGTGFLIIYGDAGPWYLVTARHVAVTFDSDPFVIRLNQKNGGGRNIDVDGAQWTYHPAGESVDAAILEFERPAWADVMGFPTRGFLVADKLQSKDISAGDIAYVVGVFSLLHGKQRNMPIVHTGHIAMLAEDEEIPVYAWEAPLLEPDGSPRFVQTHGYLVEANTHPGSSGSPVFVRRSIRLGEIYAPTIQLMRTEPGPPMEVMVSAKSSFPEEPDRPQRWTYGSRWLLGIWQGAWGEHGGKLISVPGGKTVPSLGIGSVVPAARIMEMLELPDVKARREARMSIC